jgi:GNAT superfamily N-acetyltransferase
MKGIELRSMQPTDRLELAELIYLSTNTWYQSHGRPPVLLGGPETGALFFDVYEALDADNGVVAVSTFSGRLVGSCFYHPRPTHVSLGILNVHPNYFGRGVARALVQYIIDLAQRQQKSVRLVSSASNLDSFSLYNRAGFVPQVIFQDQLVTVPAEGLSRRTAGDDKVRSATLADTSAMDRLEKELVGISREQDYRYFLDNREGFWHVFVYPDDHGGLNGFLTALTHPSCTTLGPGLARTPEQAAALILIALNQCRGRTVLLLVPAQCSSLVQQTYQWGATNCEIHFSQVLGPCPPVRGILMPTFLPESG